MEARGWTDRRGAAEVDVRAVAAGGLGLALTVAVSRIASALFRRFSPEHYRVPRVVDRPGTTKPSAWGPGVSPVTGEVPVARRWTMALVSAEIVFALFVGLGAFVLTGALSKPGQIDTSMVAFSVVLLVAGSLGTWLLHREVFIRFTDQGISYLPLLGRRRFLAWQDVTRVTVNTTRQYGIPVHHVFCHAAGPGVAFSTSFFADPDAVLTLIAQRVRPGVLQGN